MPAPEEMLKITRGEIQREPELEIVIEFIKPNAPYWVGEEVRLTAREAENYIRAGVAKKIADVPVSGSPDAAQPAKKAA